MREVVIKLISHLSLKYREKMRMISIPIQLNDERSASWIKKMGKGFCPDKTLLQLVGFDAEMEVTNTRTQFLLNVFD